jgi:hypothetical protein
MNDRTGTFLAEPGFSAAASFGISAVETMQLGTAAALTALTKGLGDERANKEQASSGPWSTSGASKP